MKIHLNFKMDVFLYSIKYHLIEKSRIGKTTYEFKNASIIPFLHVYGASHINIFDIV